MALAVLLAAIYPAGPPPAGATTPATPPPVNSTMPPSTPTVDVVANIPYYQGGPTLDAFLPIAVRTHRPALVTVHGGGWQGGGDAEFAPLAMQAAQEQGWAVFSVNYRLDENDRRSWPDELHDVQAAVRFIAHNADAFDIDPTQLVMIGESAGGNLVALISSLGTAEPVSGQPAGSVGAGTTVTGTEVAGQRLTNAPTSLAVNVNAVALWSPPTDIKNLEPNPGTKAAPACGADPACNYVWDNHDVQQYMGCTKEACPQKYREASPVDQVQPTTRPTFISNSTDEVVPLAQAQAYVAALQADGVVHQFQVVNGNLHALQTSPEVWGPTVTFLSAHLAGTTPGPAAAGSDEHRSLTPVLVTVAALAVLIGLVAAVHRRRARLRPTAQEVPA